MLIVYYYNILCYLVCELRSLSLIFYTWEVFLEREIAEPVQNVEDEKRQGKEDPGKLINH